GPVPGFSASEHRPHFSVGRLGILGRDHQYHLVWALSLYAHHDSGSSRRPVDRLELVLFLSGLAIRESLVVGVLGIRCQHRSEPAYQGLDRHRFSLRYHFRFSAAGRRPAALTQDAPDVQYARLPGSRGSLALVGGGAESACRASEGFPVVLLRQRTLSALHRQALSRRLRHISAAAVLGNDAG